MSTLKKIPTKKKGIKRLINQRTVNEAIEALIGLSREGYGKNIITVDSDISRYGNTYTSTANIAIAIPK